MADIVYLALMCQSRFTQSPNKKSTDLTMQRAEAHVPITKEYATGKSHFFLTVWLVV